MRPLRESLPALKARATRPDLTAGDFHKALAQLRVRLHTNRERHGPRPYATRDDVLDAIREELLEVEGALHFQSDARLLDELLDVAAAAMWEAAAILREET